MSIEALNERVAIDLSYLAFGGATWVRQIRHPEGHVYDAVIVGGGQSGLGIAFGLMRERIYNILIVDENPEGMEGPWETYARMMTLRTPKHLTSIDLGVPSLTFRSWWEAQFGPEGWEAIDKIPRGDWMNYLRWYRKVLNLPVVNETKLTMVEQAGEGIHRLRLEGAGAPSVSVLARKVVLATGIQGGGEWHVPPMIADSLPQHLYAHTSQRIDFAALRGKKVAVLGGGASAFDNANFALDAGVAEAHVFVRRRALPRVNPIRQMEGSGMIERFPALQDADKYAVISHFFRFNQPPTNDTFERASAWPGFALHLGAPWLAVRPDGNGAVVTTPQGDHFFDFLIVSTGLLTDPALRPELSRVERHIARWGDRYAAPAELASPLLDTHPYLTPGFAFTSRDEAGKAPLHGLFTFNYSALVSCGISASALSGMKFGIPRLVAALADQLFLDDREETLGRFYGYDVQEFVGEWPRRSQEA
ncbi:FAD/NAD(P)-binding protein [Cohnella hashimotonis]|uniref:NAD(P)/FAD-dependent oxidoreductase n=1 Tax=Cohnella hashimotonis TaxID=2826895 RepID=A0ABT6TEH8_9BACL|nr:NAD(P)/FAD-dependent oxidoreductase [Cohnella hashimotonis]MDI4645243.1 NAD(P)/FAD-dependent oxidoreductase [Cohnella hashimotonis]